MSPVSFHSSVQLYGREYKPAMPMQKCQDECHSVADLLDVTAVTGEDATKQAFLDTMATATVLHIGKYGLGEIIISFCLCAFWQKMIEILLLC